MKPKIKKGDEVVYRAIAGDRCPAIVRNVRDDGFVDIEVFCSPQKNPRNTMLLNRITVDEKMRGCAWPKEK